MRLYKFFFLFFLLNSCCGRVVCDCLGNWYDAIGFQFVKLPLEGGFAEADIDTVRFYRLDIDEVVLDSVELYRDTSHADEYMTFDSTHYLLILGGWMGIYGTENKIDLTKHHFRLSLLDGTQFNITDIVLENETYKVNKCCECPKNIQKTCKVNGQVYDLSGKEELGEIAIGLKQ